MLENDPLGKDLKPLVNIQDVRGRTALYWTAVCRNLEAARILIKHGADVDLPEAFNMTPLIPAISRQNLDMVKLLLSAGANPYHAVFEDGTADTLEYAEDVSLEWKETFQTLFAKYRQPIRESAKKRLFDVVE